MRRLLLSTIAGLLILGAFLSVLDPARLANQLAGANLAIFAIGPVAVLAALSCWSEATRRLFVAFDSSLSRRRAFTAYAAGAFGKQVLPMGNAGGPAVMAYAYDREVSLGYSRSLAVIVVAQFLSLAASIILTFVGIAVLLLLNPLTPDIRLLGIGVVLVGIAMVALSVVIWYRRRHVGLAVGGIVRLVRPIVAQISPAYAARLSPARVDASLQQYYDTFDMVVYDRRAVLYAFLLSQIGWIFFALPLYTAALSLDVRLPLALALVLVPAAGLATVIPVPGGLGGVEVALSGLLGTLAGVDLTTAGAVVILFRLASFWFFVLICGTTTSLAAVSLGELAAPLEGAAAVQSDSGLHSPQEDVE